MGNARHWMGMAHACPVFDIPASNRLTSNPALV